jgi:hypothetical protein
LKAVGDILSFGEFDYGSHYYVPVFSLLLTGKAKENFGVRRAAG